MVDRRRVLVAGATGFIGRNVAEALALRPEYHVRGVYHRVPPWQHPAVEWVQADLTRAEDCQRVLHNVDVLVQAAATTSGARDIVERPYIHVADNAVMNSHLFRACFDLKVGQVLFFSCSIVYQPGERPVREDDYDPAAPLHPRYFAAGSTKLYLEQMCRFYSGLGTARYTVVRHSNVYGPHDKFDLERSHVFGATVTKVLAATDGAVTIWGDGTEARDLLYVSDLVRFVELALDRQDTPFELLNVGAGSAVSVNDLVSRVIAASGRDLQIRHQIDRPSIPFSLSLDCARAQERFGWAPRVDLDEGIARTIAWWRQNQPVSA